LTGNKNDAQQQSAAIAAVEQEFGKCNHVQLRTEFKLMENRMPILTRFSIASLQQKTPRREFQPAGGASWGRTARWPRWPMSAASFCTPFKRA